MDLRKFELCSSGQRSAAGFAEQAARDRISSHLRREKPQQHKRRRKQHS